MENAASSAGRRVRDYILAEFLPAENPESLRDDTPLITGGLLDSIEITRLVIFIEETYGFEFRADEITAENIDTIEKISRFVLAKTATDA